MVILYLFVSLWQSTIASRWWKIHPVEDLSGTSMDRLTNQLFAHAKLHHLEDNFPPCKGNFTKPTCRKDQTCSMIDRRSCADDTCEFVSMPTCITEFSKGTSTTSSPTPSSPTPDRLKSKKQDFFEISSGSPSLTSKALVRRALRNITVTVQLEPLTPVYQLDRDMASSLDLYSPIFHLLGKDYARDRHTINGDGFHLHMHRSSACRRLPRAHDLAVVHSDALAIQLNNQIGSFLSKGKNSFSGVVTSRSYSGDTQVLLYKLDSKRWRIFKFDLTSFSS